MMYYVSCHPCTLHTILVPFPDPLIESGNEIFFGTGVGLGLEPRLVPCSGTIKEQLTSS